MPALHFPSLPNGHAIAAMLLTLVALYLFTRDKIALETSSMIVLATLTVGFTLFPYEDQGKTLHAIEFFHGFGHEALVAVCALMIVGQGLVRTGALEPLGRLLAGLWRLGPTFAMFVTLSVAAILSAFVNNTPIVVLLLPVLVSVSARNKTSPSGVLMPMGLATLIGGAATTIGTSTNLLVVSVAADMGLRPMGIFSFVVPAAMAGVAGIVFLAFIAPRLLPKRAMQLLDTSRRVFTAQLCIRKDGFADGKKLSEANARAGAEMHVIRIQRGKGSYVLTFPDTVLRADDRLLLTDTPENLKRYEVALGGALYAGDVEIGDVLLVQGAAEQIRALRSDDQFLVLDATADLPHSKKSPTAIVIMAGVILVAAFGVLPISISAVTGVLLMVATRCLNWGEVGKALNTQVILIVVASLGLGTALLKTGGAEYLAQVFVAVTFGAPPIVLLSGLILLMGILTNVVSSNAAAVIGTPIAISIAHQIGQPPEAFVLAVIFGANLCYATPLAHKINVLVMASGNYTFGDFSRVGLPLAVIMWLAYTAALGAVYGI